MNETSTTQETSELEGSSALDHALLESLFYNEMMMLNSASQSSSNFLSHHFIEATHPRQHAIEPPVTTCDPNTIAEKDLLRDFGVSSSPVRQSMPSHYSPPDPNSATIGSSVQVDPWSAPVAHPQHANIAATIALPAPAPKHIPIYPAPSQTPPLHPCATSKPPSVILNRPPLSIDTTAPAVPEDRAKQLVDQFATLASRLGIELPKHVLQSLTAAAAKNDPQLTSSNIASIPSENKILEKTVPLPEALQQPDFSASSVPVLTDTEEAVEAGPPTIQELRKTAEEAIASVTRKRGGADSDGTDSVGGSAKDGSTKHGKRKKKPRLSDCESRLAELRAENDVLKRHLENVSNKAQRFDQEKEAAGKRIHALLEQNAGPEEMIQAVQEFTEMYSDYGRNRQQELSFHLEQLQR